MGIDARLVFDDEWIERLAVAILGARDELFFVKSKQCCVFLSFCQKCWVQGEDSRFLSCFFKGDLFWLDVSNSGVSVKCIADVEDVCGPCCGALEYCLCFGLSITGNECPQQAIDFSGAWWLPPEGPEVVSGALGIDSAVSWTWVCKSKMSKTTLIPRMFAMCLRGLISKVVCACVKRVFHPEMECLSLSYLRFKI